LYRRNLLALSAVAILAGSVAAAPRSVLRCRRMVANDFAFMIDESLTHLASCHAARKPATDCNLLDGVPVYTRAVERAKGIAKAFCTGDNPILDNFPDAAGDIVSPTAPVMRRRLEESGQTLQAVSVLPAGRAGRQPRRCTRAIGRARKAIIGRQLDDAIHCETLFDRTTSGELGEVSGTCIGGASRVSQRSASRITTACAGVDPAVVGTCTPLPNCVVDSVVATGQELVADIYGTAPDQRAAKCGNGELDAGEECDDGNRDDNDACTNKCKVAQCGDGSVETGVEECDDGNRDENDGCTIDCKLARCGDGIVETGVEECDDGDTNGTPGDPCQADCKFPPVACSASGTIEATLTLVPKKDGSTLLDPKGITLTLGYPSGLSIPGSGILPLDDPNDPATRVALLDLDFYNGLVVFSDSDTVLKTSVALSTSFSQSTALPFERVIFDCAPNAIFDAGQLQCTIAEETDPLGGSVTPTSPRAAVLPSCSVVLTATQ
jgi:cysteine-rich repeat protein